MRRPACPCLAAALLALAAVPRGALGIHVGQPEEAKTEEPKMPWYMSASMYHFPQLFATDLAAPRFESQLRESTAKYVLVEFYAPWCPHCQHFAPEYERIALSIRNAQKGDDSNGIFTGMMDCVLYASACTAWGVQGYPTMMWATRADWLALAGGGNASQGLQTVEPEGPRNAETIVQWVQNASGIALDVGTTSRAEVQRMLIEKRTAAASPAGAVGLSMAPVSEHLGQSSVPRADAWDAQLAVALNLRMNLAQLRFQMGREDGPKKVLLDFVNLLARRFPEHGSVSSPSTCRRSLAALDGQLRSNWTGLTQSFPHLLEKKGFFEQPNPPVLPPEAKYELVIDPEQLEADWKLCDTDWDSYARGFSGCRGTWPGKRGYTCGLWTMFHMLAARSEDETAYSDLEVVRSFVANFFDCTDCRDHFMALPVRAEDITSRRSAQLWWWSAHNVVNERVRRIEEAQADGDPAFPKAQWPTGDLCSDCRLRPAAETTDSPDPAALLAPAGLLGKKPASLLGETPAVLLGEAHAVAEGWAVDRLTAFLDAHYGGDGERVMV